MPRLIASSGFSTLHRRAFAAPHPTCSHWACPNSIAAVPPMPCTATRPTLRQGPVTRALPCDWNVQIAQYHWESRAAGLVGPEYDITFIEPMLVRTAVKYT